jgi:Fe2+ or Zn2+ uptake regulation protein
MPTVLWLGRLRVVVYFNDHRPAHVHVIGNGCEAVFDLHCPAGPVSVRENYGFKRKEIARLLQALTNHLSELCRAWEEIHGNA